MKATVLVILFFAFVLAGCGPKPAAVLDAPTGTPVPTLVPTPTIQPTPTSPFDYNASLPFDMKVNSQEAQNGVTVLDISYAAHDPAFSPATGGRTLAYLITPDGEGPFAGILYLHWQGGGRNEFLEEAKAFAAHGAVCLLIQGFFPWLSAPTGLASDRAAIQGQILELRRAVDFLLAQKGVDPARLGYVGHDYGAIYGGILAGVDHRIHSYVLSGGAPHFSDWIGFSNVPPQKYVEMVGDLDPIHYVSDAAPAALFFQFGQRDGIISHDLGTSYFDAASEPKQVTWYDDLHGMTSAAVTQGRQEWLISQLQLKP